MSDMRFNAHLQLYSNRLGLHPLIPLTVALADQTYDIEAAGQLSASTLANPPQMNVLKVRKQDEIVQDVSDMSFSVFGTAIHNGLDSLFPDPFVAELRFCENLGGFNVCAKVDLVVPYIEPEKWTTAPAVFTKDQYLDWYLRNITPGKVELVNWKVTSVYSVKPDKDKHAWMRQAVVELTLAEMALTDTEIVPRPLYVTFLRDWSKAAQKRERVYPACPMVVMPLEVAADPAARRQWIIDQCNEHVQAHESGIVRECEEREKWQDPAQLAVMKPGRTRAVKLFDPEDALEATKLAVEVGGNVEERPAVARRCEEYCLVKQWCPQYAAENSP